MDYNLRERELYCAHCKTYTVSREPNPKCIDCGQGLYTVLYSIIDGKPITGSDEKLA